MSPAKVRVPGSSREKSRRGEKIAMLHGVRRDDGAPDRPCRQTIALIGDTLAMVLLSGDDNTLAVTRSTSIRPSRAVSRGATARW